MDNEKIIPEESDDIIIHKRINNTKLRIRLERLKTFGLSNGVCLVCWKKEFHSRECWYGLAIEQDNSIEEVSEKLRIIEETSCGGTEIKGSKNAAR